ncbi:MAG: transposase [Actinomycetia bacterium]|nr:transposase [Actinomycetes bacterium]
MSTGDFPTALEAILGVNAKNISANTIVRLKDTWEKEYLDWSIRDLSNKKYIYFWTDAIHLNVRLQKERPCILVIMAADQDGNKELLAVSDGLSESKISWKDILLDLRHRGLSELPKLAVGDGALGFWSALTEVFPDTLNQRCWVHKTRNILDKLPKSLRPQAKNNIQSMYMAPNKKEAYKEFDKFIEIYQDKYPKATECLQKDKDTLFTF